MILSYNKMQCRSKYAVCWSKNCVKIMRVTGKAIGKSENSRLIDEAFCQMIESLLTIVIDNSFRKRDKSRTVIVYLPEGRVTKVNCWVVSRATTTSVQKSIPTETCSEIAVSLISFSSSVSYAASYSIRRISVLNINCLRFIFYM